MWTSIKNKHPHGVTDRARVVRFEDSLELYAPIVARKLKYRSNHAKADQCIAVIVTVKSD